jgi:hypothetical protein
MLSVAIALAVFFLVMGALREGKDEPFIPAGVAASAVLVSAVIIRRAIIRRRQERYHAARQLESNLAPLRMSGHALERKLSIEQNALLLKELKRKSEAATVLGKYSEGHREVFVLCGQYLDINEREMQNVNPGSPRIAALRRGREIAEDFHRRHMLKWAEIEATSLLEDAQTAGKTSEKIEMAGRALAAIDTASVKYPGERKLKDSAVVIGDYIIGVKVRDLLERASKAELKGNTKLATRHIKTALTELEKSSNAYDGRDSAVEKIRSELARLTSDELKS